MKFDCDECGTRYNIADEKVRRKVLKIRCRVCENVITVRGADLEKRDGAEDGEGAATAGWFAAPDGEELGPMPLERLQGMVELGEVGADTLVWCEGMPDWIAVGAVPELVAHLPKTTSLDDEATSTFELHDRIDDSLRRTLLSTPPPRAAAPEADEPERRGGMGWETEDDARPTVAEPRIGPLVSEAPAGPGGDPQRRMLVVLIGLAVIVLLALVAAIAWWVSQPPGMRPGIAPTMQPAPDPQPGARPTPPAAPEAPPGGSPGQPPGAPPPPPAATPPPAAPTGASAAPPTDRPPDAPPGARALPIAGAPPKTLEQADVEAVIGRHADAIETCRSRHVAAKGPLPADRAVLSFDLRPTGRVSNPRLDPPLAGTLFARCMQEAARTWRFPVFTGEPIPVQYPFEWAER